MIAAATLATLGSAPALYALGTSSATEARGLAPGKWDIATRMDHLDIPGIPPAMVNKIAADPANAKPRSVCIAATAGAPPPFAVFHTLNGACTYETWQAEAGTLRAVLACSPPNGGPGHARVEVNGSYTASTFQLASETIARDETGATQLHMRSTISGTLTAAGANCAAS